ncbi:MAG: type VI secretion system baseplate subunit TssE [Rhodospirillales bacterium]|nr:type VI secretion system baseplate subunit TssE [Rhodospirillales bacterium]
MAETASRERLQPSLLDRLTDNAPESKRETFDQQTLTIRSLRQAVLRDLAWLLNTTNLAATEDLSAYPLAAKSTINFGIPGLAGQAAIGNRFSAIDKELAEAVRVFEPRIQSDSLMVRSSRGGGANAAVPALRFEIEGALWALPVPEQLFVETAIDMETRLAVVTDPRNRG